MVDGGQGEEGRTLGAGGRYVIRGLLGEGGMASVHRALDTVLDRDVAIKTMHSEFSREDAFRQRFTREAQAVARLNHTNIVAVYDSGEEPGTDGAAPVPFIVMEYVEGEPLRDALNDAIERFGAMPLEQALSITADVLAALSASHEMGLVHRDIKPGNVMLTRRGVVKVMDFGIARAMQSGVTSMTQTGMVVGTPQYLSPEQALGRGVDHRSDLYTTGVMLFELITGQLPFDGDSPLSIAYHHVQTPPPAPSSLNSAIPPAVDAFLARALAKDPAQRFPTADAMRDEIRRISNSPETHGGNTPIVIAPGPMAGAPHSSQQQQVFSPVDPAATPQPGYGYGYPQQTGYQTPAPSFPSPAPDYRTAAPPAGPNPYQGGGGSGAPAAPSGGGHGGSGGKSKGPVIAIASVVVAAVIIGVVVIVLANTGKKPNNPDAKSSHSAPAKSDESAKASSSPSASVKAELQGPTDPAGGYKDADFASCDNVYPDSDGKITLPNLQYQTVKWAKECAARPAVSVQTKIVYSKNSVWRKGTVLDQNPRTNAVVKKGSTVTLTVSSGP